MSSSNKKSGKVSKNIKNIFNSSIISNKSL